MIEFVVFKGVVARPIHKSLVREATLPPIKLMGKDQEIIKPVTAIPGLKRSLQITPRGASTYRNQALTSARMTKAPLSPTVKLSSNKEPEITYKTRHVVIDELEKGSVFVSN